MKMYIIIIVFGIICAGCSTTTFLNLSEDEKGKVRRELNKYEKNKKLGAEITLSLQDGSEINGELLSVRDTALILCTEYAASAEKIMNSAYPVLLVNNNVVQEITLEGSAYIWPGIAAGAIVGTATGALIGSSSDELFAGVQGMMQGFFIGLSIGWIIGYDLSAKEYVLQEIPPGYNFYFLKNLGRYKEKEPEYLKAINQK